MHADLFVNQDCNSTEISPRGFHSGIARVNGPVGQGMQFGGVEMRKHVPRRALVVAALLVVSSAAMAAVAVSSGGETTSKNATRGFGIARASSGGSSSSVSGTSLASTATAGPQVINGNFQGTSP